MKQTTIDFLNKKASLLNKLNVHFEVNENEVKFKFNAFEFYSNDYFDVYSLVDEEHNEQMYYSKIQSQIEELEEDEDYDDEEELKEEVLSFKIEHKISVKEITLKFQQGITVEEHLNKLEETLNEIKELSFAEYLKDIELFNNTVDQVIADTFN